ncbi:hypothetical protein CI102_947 [Trichoderma harzianum]|uniref:Uncharacterized protein n=1 Tax=Trichoderma harzianum CBS 226.95 TaxID=983964 RepID=A0A2T4ABQ7_TRIHA|nr:hypothetical protein M431DRAFT_421807 [Trichoderma harzianum CBS 226.95]PKK54450.1 hypothetical protein CI102_947 [Trichoderma harzianum]PTB54482.1 hypothetical protein M431DRAFT_421807 [Trichoderma harzianum CBS 226.95]
MGLPAKMFQKGRYAYFGLWTLLICSKAASEKAPLTAAARHYCTLCEIGPDELPDGAGDGSCAEFKKKVDCCSRICM